MFSYEDAPNMEREKQEQICQQLRMLAEGRHPLTGKELPLTGAFGDAAVLRTLTQASHCLRDLLEQETPAPARRAKRERRGKFCIILRAFRDFALAGSGRHHSLCISGRGTDGQGLRQTFSHSCDKRAGGKGIFADANQGGWQKTKSSYQRRGSLRYLYGRTPWLSGGYTKRCFIRRKPSFIF